MLFLQLGYGRCFRDPVVLEPHDTCRQKLRLMGFFHPFHDFSDGTTESVSKIFKVYCSRC